MSNTKPTNIGVNSNDRSKRIIFGKYYATWLYMCLSVNYFLIIEIHIRIWYQESLRGNQNQYIEEEQATMTIIKSTKGQTTIYKTYI